MALYLLEPLQQVLRIIRENSKGVVCLKQDRKLYKPKQKRSEATRNKILDTAMKLFGQDGYYGVSTNEIAQEANISIGNLYFYFLNKEEIFLQILNRYYQSFMEVHEEFLKEMNTLGGNPKIFLNRLLRTIIGEYICIFRGNQKVGYYRFHSADEKMELDDFYVLSPYQGQGIGSEIIRKCIAETNLPIFLYVFIQNSKAVSLYKRFGFGITETIKDSRYIMER